MTAARVAAGSQKACLCRDALSGALRHHPALLLRIPGGNHGAALLRSLACRRSTSSTFVSAVLLLLLLVAPPGAAAPVAVAVAVLFLVLVLLGLLGGLPQVLGVVIVHLSHDSALDGSGNVLDVHEIAVGSSIASGLVKRSAARLSEIGDRGVLGLNQLAAVETACQLHEGSLSILFVVVLHIDIADHVVAQIIHHDQVLNLAVVCQLQEHLHVEGLQVRLRPVIHVVIPGLIVGQGQALRSVGIHMGEQQGLTHRRPVVKSIALVTISTGPDLEVERTVHAILLSSENPRQLLRHGNGCF
mmetsp:Transcript_56253/g.105463  ORF Transcript_56253/g.105463 Transcript_56253/m.105463 type:complete len:301 (+) Transcript_56253:41-943(+)